jgi:hypothetical protein
MFNLEFGFTHNLLLSDILGMKSISFVMVVYYSVNFGNRY